MIVRRSFRYRLYPTKGQATAMRRTLDLCRELYNAALQERRDAWRLNRVSLNYHTQRAQLPALRARLIII